MAAAPSDPRLFGTVWVLEPDQAVPVVTPRLPVTLARAGPEAASALVQAMGQADATEVLARFAAGSHGFLAWARAAGDAGDAGDAVAAYGWASYGEAYVGELGLRLRLLAGEAYVWDCATQPAFRRRGIYTALLAYIATELRGAGVRRLWIGADLANVPSQQGIARAGFQPVADLGVARILGLRLMWLRARPGVPAGLVAEAQRLYLSHYEPGWLAALLSRLAR